MLLWITKGVVNFFEPLGDRPCAPKVVVIAFIETVEAQLKPKPALEILDDLALAATESAKTTIRIHDMYISISSSIVAE
jgi:hypothetical protein